MLYDDGTAQHLGILKDAATAESDSLQLSNNGNALRDAVDVLYASLFINGPESDPRTCAQDLAKQEEQDINAAEAAANKMDSVFRGGPFLDCFVNTAMRIADLDLLKEVGEAANDINPVRYPYSHTERFGGENVPSIIPKELNLMSVNQIDSSLGVSKWYTDLPSYVDTTAAFSPV